MSGNILWSPKWGRPDTRRSGASAIADAKLQRFSSLHSGISVHFPRLCSLRKSCCGILALVHWYTYETLQFSPSLHLLANHRMLYKIDDSLQHHEVSQYGRVARAQLMAVDASVALPLHPYLRLSRKPPLCAVA
jgi:hypothetical protein